MSELCWPDLASIETHCVDEICEDVDEAVLGDRIA